VESSQGKTRFVNFEIDYVLAIERDEYDILDHEFGERFKGKQRVWKEDKGKVKTGKGKVIRSNDTILDLQ
jgi:hypothetical protein